jgi:hypothetical protein
MILHPGQLYSILFCPHVAQQFLPHYNPVLIEYRRHDFRQAAAVLQGGLEFGSS